MILSEDNNFFLLFYFLFSSFSAFKNTFKKTNEKDEIKKFHANSYL